MIRRSLYGAGIVLLSVLLLLLPTGAAAGTRYVPAAGDRFSYSETISLNGGTGNYTGYTESTAINGSLSIIAAASNGTATANYYNLNSWQNNQGQSSVGVASGSFTFSDVTYHYLNGTDNQTGYVDPYVWFYIDDALPAGQSFYILNTQMSVVGAGYDYPLETSAGTDVQTLFTEGNGSFQRNDVYGEFSASYNWKAFYDASTGYIVGYVYTEHDSGVDQDGFTMTDTLGVTQTTYALTPGAALPHSGPGGSSSSVPVGLIVGLVIVGVLIVVVIAVAVSRSRRRAPLARHSSFGSVSYAPPPGMAPPPISLSPGGQPAVQQIVVKETVKVNCRYCGGLIDTTVEKCPFCGAART